MGIEPIFSLIKSQLQYQILLRMVVKVNLVGFEPTVEM